jgi:hypothetical protein
MIKPAIILTALILLFQVLPAQQLIQAPNPETSGFILVRLGRIDSSLTDWDSELRQIRVVGFFLTSPGPLAGVGHFPLHTGSIP